MAKRKIITIDQEKCTGCGLCIPNCPEGALQIIDGKARLVGDLFCDGLGACLGYCPEAAISVEEREAEAYDEARVMANIAPQGANTIRAHLEHLESHGEKALAAQAREWLTLNRIPVPPMDGKANAGCSEHARGGVEPRPRGGVEPRPRGGVEPRHTGCPGSEHKEMKRAVTVDAPRQASSELGNWPIQLHLLSPTAPQFEGKDVLLAADCTAFASGSFHADWLKGRTLAIACPKLDDDQEIYREKITALIDHARISSLTVMIMQVPCCRGLLSVVQEARARAHRDVPVKAVIVGIENGAILAEQDVPA
jgi:ferredoxin